MSRFTDHLGLVEYDDDQGRPILREGRTQYKLDAALSYDVGCEGSGETITVPWGFVTDLASIPEAVWSLGFAPNGPWSKAAIVHDFLYATGGTGEINFRRYITRQKPYSRAEADGILREAMGVLGVPAWRRFVIWSAVRVGGAPGWDKP